MKCFGGKIWPEFETACYHRGKLWFTENDTNEVYYFDFQKMATYHFVEILGEERYVRRLFGAIVGIDEYLYLVSYNAKKMYRVNIDTKEVEILHEGTLFCLSAHVYQNMIIMVATQLPALYVYNLCSKTLQALEGWETKLDCLELTNDNAYFRKSYLMDGVVYAPLAKGNGVIIWKLKTEEIDVRIIGEPGNSYCGITYDGAEFWLASRENGEITIWNPLSDICSRILIDRAVRNKYPYADIICKNEYIYLIPFSEPDLVIVKAREREVNRLGTGTGCFVQTNDNLYYFSSGKNALLCIRNDKILKEYPICLDSVGFEYHLDWCHEQKNVWKKANKEMLQLPVYESFDGELTDYIAYVVKCKGDM